MFQLSGFQIVESIGSNERISLYRLLRMEDGSSFIAKTTTREHDSGTQMAAVFKYEYEQLVKWKGHGICEPYSLEMTGDRPVLLFRDQDGVSLKQLLQKERDTMRLPELLSVAIAIVDCVRRLHEEQIMINELTPLYLIVSKDLTEVKLIDIGACSMGKGAQLFPPIARRAASVLPYLSPEQTGRTGMLPDYRSDYYSLGVILYEWFTNELPFQSRNAMDLVYHHLATTPEPVQLRNHSIPKMVSDIVMKCMEKMPDTRYMSAFGIQFDLEECLVQLRVSGKVRRFPLANQDQAFHWNRLEGVFGRRSEQQVIAQAIQRASQSKSISAEVVWVSGAAGIGKTSLVMETLRKIAPAEGLFIVVQFERTDSAPPSAIWKQIMEQIVSHHNQLIVLFLDQLQWADEASMHLLADLLEDQMKKQLLVVGAYRDSEIIQAAEHPLGRLMKRMEDNNIISESIHLAVYDHADLKRLLIRFFQEGLDGMEDLVRILLQKTGGNPFFLKPFLQQLLDRRLVSFNAQNRHWQSDIQLISELNVHDNLVDTITNSLEQLSSDECYMLGRAAFLGKTFQLHTLTYITGNTMEQLSRWAAKAVSMQIVQPVYGKQDWYTFQHDQIMRSAYELVAEQDRAKLHLEIGWILAHRMRSHSDVQLLDVLYHLNPAQAKITNREDRLQLAELNLQAGMNAKEAMEIDRSLEYLRRASQLLKEEGNSDNYALYYRVHMELAEAEFQCANYDMASAVFQLLLNHASTNEDQASIYIMMIQMEMNRVKYNDAILLAENALRLLDFPFSFQPGLPLLAKTWIRVHRKLRMHPVQSFEQFPPMTDERIRTVIAVMAHTIHSNLTMNKQGWLLAVLTIIELSMDYGITPEASLGFVGYAVLQHYQFHQYQSSYQWGELAQAVSKERPKLYVQVYTTFSLCFDSWRNYHREYLNVFTDSVGRVALHSGDAWLAHVSSIINCGLRFRFSYSLNEIYDQLLAHFIPLQGNNSSHALLWKQSAVFADLLRTLIGHKADNDPFQPVDLSKQANVDIKVVESDQVLDHLICLHHYITGYTLGNIKQAYAALEKSKEGHQSNTMNFQDPSNYYYYEVLILKELYDKETGQEQAHYRQRMARGIKQLKRMARRCSVNYMHKYLLAKAELARLNTNDSAAERLYEQALDAARAGGFLHDTAIIAECYANYGLKCGKPAIAKLYMQEAYASFLKWGALAKTAQMEEKFAHLLPLREKSETEFEKIDYLSVMMSAQALSGEMEMDRLLNTLMRIMMQNAGANFGALIFNNENKWVVEAYGTHDKQNVQSIQLENAGSLVPVTIIEYTIRTGEAIVLHDASSHDIFKKNEYVREHELKSVVCLPIIHQNKQVCLLYLENNLSTGVFTESRQDVLKLLSSQCAISISNAKLYSDIQYLKDSLEEQVEERTRELEKSMQATSEALAEMTVYAERTRIAQEIHDIVGHSLTSTILQIEAGKRLLRKDMDSAATRLSEAQDSVRHSLNEIRNSVHMLKEDKYYDIEEALFTLIKDASRNTSVRIDATIDPISHLSLMHKKVVYHALQEGLTNGIRHGNCDAFRFSLTDEGSQLQFLLEDNGRGASNIVMGFGLKMMRDRVKQLKGTLDIDTEPDKGCTLQISIPYGA